MQFIAAGALAVALAPVRQSSFEANFLGKPKFGSEKVK